MGMLRAVCVFSCIGNHARGLARAGIATVAFCELSEWRRKRIAEAFPGTPIHDDIHTFDPPPADIIIGGPPCQGTSKAAAVHGYRTGATLWPEMLRGGLAMDADWFVVEQPPGHAAWEAQVGSDLSRAGRHVARFEFGACDIGAPYLRRRVFLVASPSLPRLALAREALPSAIAGVKRAADARGDWDPDQLAALPVAAGAAGEMDRGPRSRERREWIEALGDSNPPHMAEVIGRAIMTAEQAP